MTKSPPLPPADGRVSTERRRSRAPLVLAALAGTTALLGAATVATFCRFPEIWREPSRSTAVFRVQSRSMEPTFLGPRFVWNCPECGGSFATTLDVDSSGGVRSFDDAPNATAANVDSAPVPNAPNAPNADSPEVRKFRATARFFPCPRCGFDRVPASTAVFQDGALVEATEATAPQPSAPQDVKSAATPAKPSDAEQVADAKNVWSDWSRRFERAWNAEKPELRPERWDVVVFRAPSGRATLKRVVGFPGETVEIVNGDVFVDGRVAPRTLEQTLATATRLDSTQFRRTDDRLTVVATTPIWNDAPPVVAPDSPQFPQTFFKPSAIFNESPTPRWNGDDVAPVEPVRDFVFDFAWSNADGTPTRFRLLARRPNRAFLLDFDATTATVSLRSTPLLDGKTSAGRPFDELTDADFAETTVERVPWNASPPDDANATDGATRFRVFLVDGELVLTRNGAELARFSTDDGNENATAAIATPFVLLGDVARAFAPVLRRDVHYSSVAAQESTPRRDGETSGYFLLGDNSPASLDSRFGAFGRVASDALLFRVASPPPNDEF
ncbi:MAG: hypothetical protein IJO06_00300 [Thermoguttaceae bacterium]|nr:hypothetical protein [Thermoguttaceae bacterium]